MRESRIGAAKVRSGIEEFLKGASVASTLSHRSVRRDAMGVVARLSRRATSLLTARLQVPRDQRCGRNAGFRPKADPGTDAQRLRILPHFCRWPPSAGSLGEKPTFAVAAGAKLSLAIPHGSTGRLKPRPGIRCAHSNSSITAFAALRSAVSNPSVKRP
jgi:hypothetical protein